jgi:hypothetical protein
MTDLKHKAKFLEFPRSIQVFIEAALKESLKRLYPQKTIEKALEAANPTIEVSQNFSIRVTNVRRLRVFLEKTLESDKRSATHVAIIDKFINHSTDN